jgi:hypothetical protein
MSRTRCGPGCQRSGRAGDPSGRDRAVLRGGAVGTRQAQER